MRWPAISAGLIQAEDDTRVFYFPLLALTAKSLSNFELPLWTSGIMTGYPLFADGEAGALYPLHVLLLPHLPPESAIIILRIVHGFLGSAFAYVMLRTFGCGAVGATIAGLVYGYSGIAAGQIVHRNIAAAMVWLPLAIALLERSFQSHGARRYRFAALAGIVVGVQALAAHMHVTLLSALTLVAFALYRGLWSQAPGGHLVAWLRTGSAAVGSAVLSIAIVGSVGIGLSAVQLLPLQELAAENHRWNGVTRQLADVNSIWPGGLLTLLLPRLHDTVDGGFWGPWVKWETTVYLGILPLPFALIGVLSPGRPHRLFFGGLALASMLLALGPYAPGSPWAGLHGLPGFEALRSPGRASLVLSLAVAVLVGYGVDRLMRVSQPHRLAALVVAVCGAGFLGMATVVLRWGSQFLQSPAVLPLLQSYLTLPGVPSHVDGALMTPQRVGELAARALDPTNPWTATQLVLMGGAAVIITLWCVGPRLRTFVACMAVTVLVVDLTLLSTSSHPLSRVSDLPPAIPRVLEADVDRPFRIYTRPTTREKTTQLEPNRLLASGIEEANGYSSLQPDRHAAYVAAVDHVDGQLIDLWNARYVVRRNVPELLPSFGGTSFHPERPLFLAKRSGASVRFLPEVETRATELRVVGALWDAEGVEQGTPVARLVAIGADGSERSLTLRAGHEIANARLDVPGQAVAARHAPVGVAFQYPRDDAQSRRFGEQLYYASLALRQPVVVRSVRIESLADAGIELYGLGLSDATTGEVTQVRRNAKYEEVHRDREITIFRNRAAMPRAFLVASAHLIEPGGDALALMRNGGIDLRQTAVLEDVHPDSVTSLLRSASSSDVGRAKIHSYSDGRVEIKADANREALLVLTDAYFPGWAASIDGEATTILRTNYLFRGVLVPAGTHTITFAYEPTAVRVGAVVTLATAMVVLVVLGLPGVDWWRRRNRSLIREASLAPHVAGVRAHSPGGTMATSTESAHT